MQVLIKYGRNLSKLNNQKAIKKICGGVKMILLILLNILLSNEEYKSYKNEDSLYISEIVLDYENINAMSVGTIGTKFQICYSSDGGRNFNQTIELDVNTPNIINYNSVGFNNNYFVFLMDNGFVYRSLENGEFLDTLKIPVSNIHTYSRMSVYNEEYILATYSPAYQYDNKGDTTLYEMFLSNNAFEDYQTINIDEIKNGNNWIKSIKIINNKIFILMDEYDEISEKDSIIEDYKETIYSYNIDTKEVQKVFSLNYSKTKDHIRQFFVTDEEKVYVINSKTDSLKNDTYYLSFVDNTNLIPIDIVYEGKYTSILLKEYVENDIIYLTNANKFWKINTKNNSYSTITLDYNRFSENGVFGNLFKYHLWKDKISKNFLMNSNSDVIYEFDLDFLFSINSVEILSNDNKIYPNPASKGNIVNLELEELANKIEVYDLLGNK